jgi:hypothetical protein
MKKMKTSCRKVAESDGMGDIEVCDSGNDSSFRGEIYWL